jgi:hypothetical protein
MATFELWNAESGNLLGSFATEELALEAVREAIQRNGERYGAILALGRENSGAARRSLPAGFSSLSAPHVLVIRRHR